MYIPATGHTYGTWRWPDRHQVRSSAGAGARSSARVERLVPLAAVPGTGIRVVVADEDPQVRFTSPAKPSLDPSVVLASISPSSRSVGLRTSRRRLSAMSWPAHFRAGRPRSARAEMCPRRARSRAFRASWFPGTSRVLARRSASNHCFTQAGTDRDSRRRSGRLRQRRCRLSRVDLGDGRLQKLVAVARAAGVDVRAQCDQHHAGCLIAQHAVREHGAEADQSDSCDEVDDPKQALARQPHRRELCQTRASSRSGSRDRLRRSKSTALRDGARRASRRSQPKDRRPGRNRSSGFEEPSPKSAVEPHLRAHGLRALYRAGSGTRSGASSPRAGRALSRPEARIASRPPDREQAPRRLNRAEGRHTPGSMTAIPAAIASPATPSRSCVDRSGHYSDRGPSWSATKESQGRSRLRTHARRIEDLRRCAATRVKGSV